MARTVFCGFLVATCLLSCPAFAAAPTIQATYTPATGRYAVRLTVQNTLPDDCLRSLVVGAVYDATDIVAPTGWTGYFDRCDVVWGAPTPSLYLQPGQTEDRFVFSTGTAPGVLPWSSRGVTGDYSGYVTPVLIPEPSGLLSLAAGLLGLGLWRRRAVRS